MNSIYSVSLWGGQTNNTSQLVFLFQCYHSLFFVLFFGFFFNYYYLLSSDHLKKVLISLATTILRVVMLSEIWIQI